MVVPTIFSRRELSISFTGRIGVVVIVDISSDAPLVEQVRKVGGKYFN